MINYIIKPTFLNLFIAELEELKEDKLFYGPRDIWGMAKSKMTKDELIKELRQYSNYWMDEEGMDTMFAIQIEYSDGYSVEMINDKIRDFNPLREAWMN